MSRLMTKATRWRVRPLKSQISLGIHPVWSEFSLCAQWVVQDPSFLHTDSQHSDQTGRMPRLIGVFAGCTCHFVGFVMRWLKYAIYPVTMNVCVHSYVNTFLIWHKMRKEKPFFFFACVIKQQLVWADKSIWSPKCSFYMYLWALWCKCQ